MNVAAGGAGRGDDIPGAAYGEAPQSCAAHAAETPRSTARFSFWASITISSSFQRVCAAIPSRGVIASYAWSDDYHDVIRPCAIRNRRIYPLRDGTVDAGQVSRRYGACAGTGLGATGGPGLHWQELLHDPPGRRELVAAGDGDGSGAACVRRGACRRAQTCVEASLRRAKWRSGLPRDQIYGAWEIPVQAKRRRGAAVSRVPAPAVAVRVAWTHAPRTHLSDRFIWIRSAASRTGRLNRATADSAVAAPAVRQSHFRLRHLPGGLPVESPAAVAHADAWRGCAHRKIAWPRPCWKVFRLSRPTGWMGRRFEERFRRSPVLRAKRHGMLRNVCVALGNWADVETLPALSLAIAGSGAAGARPCGVGAGPRGRQAWPFARQIRLLEEARGRESQSNGCARKCERRSHRRRSSRRPHVLYCGAESSRIGSAHP